MPQVPCPPSRTLPRRPGAQVTEGICTSQLQHSTDLETHLFLATRRRPGCREEAAGGEAPRVRRGRALRIDKRRIQTEQECGQVDGDLFQARSWTELLVFPLEHLYRTVFPSPLESFVPIFPMLWGKTLKSSDSNVLLNLHIMSEFMFSCQSSMDIGLCYILLVLDLRIRANSLDKHGEVN